MTPDELLALNPYPGLRAFAVSEADLFFGRQRQVDELVERLHASTLVAVAGASGCGKSSLFSPVCCTSSRGAMSRKAGSNGFRW